MTRPREASYQQSVAMSALLSFGQDWVMCSTSSAPHCAEGWEEKGRAKHDIGAVYNTAEMGQEEREQGGDYT